MASELEQSVGMNKQHQPLRFNWGVAVEKEHETGIRCETNGITSSLTRLLYFLLFCLFFTCLFMLKILEEKAISCNRLLHHSTRFIIIPRNKRNATKVVVSLRSQSRFEVLRSLDQSAVGILPMLHYCNFVIVPKLLLLLVNKLVFKYSLYHQK